jgi:hypothetical protein
MLLQDHRVYEHPEAQRVLPTLWESLERADHRGMARSIVRGIKMEDVFTPTGLWAGQRPVYRPNERRMNRVLKKMVRGLYYHHFNKQPLPPEWDVWVYWQHQFPALKKQPEHAAIVNALQNEPPQMLGKGVLNYRFSQASDVPEATLWLLKFYEGIEFFCGTLNPAMFPVEWRQKPEK